MKRKETPRLTLTRETLHRLSPAALTEVAGGTYTFGTSCTTNWSCCQHKPLQGV